MTEQKIKAIGYATSLSCLTRSGILPDAGRYRVKPGMTCSTLLLRSVNQPLPEAYLPAIQTGWAAARSKADSRDISRGGKLPVLSKKYS